jgi:FkbM family methyltransferase
MKKYKIFNINSITEALKARLKLWVYFTRGNITFFQLLEFWLPSSLRSKKKIVCKLFDKSFVVPDGNMMLFGALVDEIIFLNQYHTELIKEKDIIIDAGANMGIFSIFVASKYPNTTIFAFEPTPSTFNALQENVRFYPNIKVFNYGLGEKEKEGSIIVVSNNSGANHIGEGGIYINIKTIDGLKTRLDFLKMDTEGYERNILEGAKETIKKYKPIIAMSAYHKPSDKIELPKLLSNIAPYNFELHNNGAEEVFVCKPIQ